MWISHALAAGSQPVGILQDLESTTPGSPRKALFFRIGLHLASSWTGRITFQVNAVNVAARLQPLADPGASAMSRFHYSQSRTSWTLKGIYLPPHKLRTFPEHAHLPRVESVVAM